MVIIHFYAVLVLVLSFYESSAGKNCNQVRNELAHDQMNYVDCIVRNAPNVSCIPCISFHIGMVDKYNLLVSNCSKEIFNKNRMNIVYNMQKQLTDIWNKGYCDDCFHNGTESNETLLFSNLTTAFNDCVLSSNNPCIKCFGEYNDLNNFYKKMDAAKKGQICFDTEDIMNRTRSHWSKELNCCHRDKDLTFFIIASSLFGALPLVFYFGMYSYTKRMERNHEVLDAGRDAAHASTSTMAVSSTTSHSPEREIRRDSSSDEDIKDVLKTQRNVSSFENTPGKSSVLPAKTQTLKGIEKPTSSNNPVSLIDL